MDADDVVSGYGPRFFDRIEERYGREVADQVRLASMPVDVRLAVLRSRQAAIEARAGELVREHLRPHDN
jgi:hypothetical protein